MTPRRHSLPPVTLIAMIWIAICLSVVIAAHWIAPYDYQAIDLRNRLSPPVWMTKGSWAHPLGTDELGRDVLSRLIFSMRMSLAIAFAGTVIGAALGTSVGFLAARFGGLVDEAVMIAIDFQAAIPFLILALAVLVSLGDSLAIFVLVMGIYGWERYARLARSLAMSAQEHGYAVAVALLGGSSTRIYLRHILPNIGSALMVNMTLNFPETVLLETSLSFLGIGIQPPMTSLGNMVGFGRDYLMSGWWIAMAPALIILVTTLAFSLIGDWLRDRFDPNLKDVTP